jgi:hypothetical protein
MSARHRRSSFALAAAILACAFGLSPSVGAGPRPLEAAGGPRLVVRVVPARPTGGTIYAIVTIINDGSQSLWVNTRMVEGPAAPIAVPTQEIWMDLTFKSRKLDFRCQSRIRPVSKDDYRILRPGQSIDTELEISACHDLSELGSYTLIAHYVDGQSSPPKAPDGAVHLKQELVSQPVSFEVVGSRSRY